MVDGFKVVCVDRIIASAACFQLPSSTNGRKEESVPGGNESDDATKDRTFNGGISFSSSSTKAKGSVSECRICQDEDEDKDLESPCACNGTLK